MTQRRPVNYVLKPAVIDNAKPHATAYGLTDGGGLYVEVLKIIEARAETAVNHFFKRIDFGVPDFSPHGLRGTAATLLREHGFGRDVVELPLAHAEKKATVAAYSHVELAADRKRAPQYLADRVEVPATGGDVLPLRAA